MERGNSPDLSLWINKIHQGNTLDVLRTIPSGIVNCCVTSPPYWGLRDYNTAIWEGGDMGCDHIQRTNKQGNKTQPCFENTVFEYKNICKKCGAVRTDNQIGLEKTPEEYVEKLVKIFREVKRVLRDDGIFWLNLGDSYYNYRGETDYQVKQTISSNEAHTMNSASGKRNVKNNTLKGKDLVGIPWMTAFALRTDGWYLRSDVIWYKRNPMPESVTDRPTKSHEYVFLLTKSPQYYYDYKAILEPYTEPMNRWGGQNLKANGKSMWDFGTGQQTYRDRDMRPDPNGSRKRDVWDIPTKPFKGSHFAVFPETLIRPMIKAGCPKGGVVIDPFIGSGTTAVESRNQFKNYIGIELNPKYIELANRRIRRSTIQWMKNM
jgi:DNA modification methylase